MIECFLLTSCNLISAVNGFALINRLLWLCDLENNDSFDNRCSHASVFVDDDFLKVTSLSPI